MSASSGFTRLGSILMPFSSPLPLRVTVTIPAADEPSTDISARRSCISPILACISCACFIS